MITLVILLAAATAYLIYRKTRTFKDIVVAYPGNKRTDLYYGYFASLGNQLEETKDHINLFMDVQFNGPERTRADIAAFNGDAALDVAYQLFVRPEGAKFSILRSDAEARVREFFTFLTPVLPKIKILFAMDEPNNTLESGNEFYLGIAILKKVVAEFSLDVKYAVIYSADKPTICQDQFDYIGIDDYEKKSSILVGQYQRLKASLLPHQKTILVPGGAYGQDPWPFVYFAQANPEVGIVMPFLWYDDTMGAVGAKGIRSNGLRDEYVKAGKAIV